MKNALCLLCLSCIMLVAGCAGTTKTSSADSDAMDSSLAKSDQFIDHGFAFKMGHTRARIIRNLGDPLSVSVKRAKDPSPFVTNPSDEIRDEIIELVYDGLYIVLYRAAAENQELLQHVSITKDKYKLKWDLNVGVSKAAVIALLGKPSGERTDEVMYRNHQGVESYVAFHLSNDIVTKIDWWYSLE